MRGDEGGRIDGRGQQMIRRKIIRPQSVQAEWPTGGEKRKKSAANLREQGVGWSAPEKIA